MSSHGVVHGTRPANLTVLFAPVTEDFTSKLGKVFGQKPPDDWVWISVLSETLPVNIYSQRGLTYNHDNQDHTENRLASERRTSSQVSMPTV